MLHFGKETPSQISKLFQPPITELVVPDLQRLWLRKFDKLSSRARKRTLKFNTKAIEFKVPKRAVGSTNTIMTNRPGQLVFLDLMGPLPKSKGGVQYILAVIDGFSRLVKLYAIKKANARAIITHLKDDYIIQIGVPERIVSDNATPFHSRLRKKEMASHKIKVFHTPAYFPEGNSTERVNRKIGPVLRALCNEKHTKWALYLDQVEDCLNNVVRESTGFFPNMLHFGKETPSQISKLFQPPITEVVVPDLQRLWLRAFDKLSSRARKRTLKFNTKATEFKVGDAVLVRQHPISSALDASIKKLFLLFIGSYWVDKILAPNCYELIDQDGVIIGRHNSKNLKKFVSYKGL
nr:unnamed protein product [Callosobruchus chinensis]